MKVLVFGKTGQVGQELQARAGEIHLEVYGRQEANFEHPETCAELVRVTDADAVIIAAAWTAVDKAEDHEDLARLINGVTPGAIARAAAERRLPLVYISTDYVFDGTGNTAFAVDAPTGPLGAYGRSKLLGEQQVRAAGYVHAILRTSWVVSTHGHNFVKTMLRLGAQHDQINVVSDQIGGPTAAADIADACLSIVRQLLDSPEKSGTYHFSGAPDVSWAEFASEIFTQLKISCHVSNIQTSDYPTQATRPLNSRLDNSLLQSTFSISRPDWRNSLTSILKTVGENKT